MAQSSRYTARIDGLRDFQRSVRQLRDRDLNRTVRETNKRAAEILKPEAIAASPDGRRDRKSNKRYRPGKLDRSIKITASAKSAVVKAGSAARVPYAAAIHFGFPRRGIRANRFLFRAMARKSEEITETYSREIADIVRDRLGG